MALRVERFTRFTLAAGSAPFAAVGGSVVSYDRQPHAGADDLTDSAGPVRAGGMAAF